MTEKEQLQIRKLIGKICDVCMRINQETERAAFVHISGHVSKIYADVVVSKDDFTTKEFSSCARYDLNKWGNLEQVKSELCGLLAALEKFLADELAK